MEDVVDRSRRTVAADRPLLDAPLSFLFIDGGHGEEPARLDYEGWAPHVASGGTLAIHDVFPDPADGGRPPYEQIYLPALRERPFTEIGATGSLRLLRRILSSRSGRPRTPGPVSPGRRRDLRLPGSRARGQSCMGGDCETGVPVWPRGLLGPNLTPWARGRSLE